ncbi:uncharacterized protein [Nicotiana tomentosiformis]|uniref:uncharacterized protein n=1 Tax=Nicotiana tomentosiformis TaxID=4098 RepID=UPI00051BAA8C|nr:uncharacterized protein LOC104116130 [Nicotiana tomentosiformis]
MLGLPSPPQILVMFYILWPKGFSSDVHYGKDIVDPLPTFKMKASHLLEANLNLIPQTRDTHWYTKLMKSLGNFNHSKAIALRCENDKEIVLPKYMRENLLPPLYATKILHIKMRNRYNFSAVDVVDCLLWMSPQLDTLSFDQTRDLKSLIKFTYRDEDEDEKPCCASLPWKCWRHELKNVKLQNFENMELQELRNYFLTNTNNTPEIIEDPTGCNIYTSFHWIYLT